MHSRRAFTLIELLVVIAIIAVLAVVVVLTLNPAQLLQQSRDANRISDMATLNSAINLYSTDQNGQTGYSLGNGTTTYISTPDTASSCPNLGLPSSTYVFNCATSANYRNASGTGWLPVSFTKISSGAPFGNLPVDPANQTSTNLYYTYATQGGQYVLSAFMESSKYSKNMTSGGGVDPGEYQIGSGVSTMPTIGRGLVGYWPFNEGSGGTVTDWSPTGNTGTLSGSYVWASSNCKVWANCLTFTLGHALASVAVTSTMAGPFTLAAWVNTASTTASQIFLQFNSLPYLRILGDKTFFSANIGGGQTSTSGGTLLAAGTWYFIVGTYDGANMNIYLNGALDAQKAAVGTVVAGGTAQIWLGDYSGGGHPLIGSMGEVRVYDRALSQSEIQELYNAEK